MANTDTERSGDADFDVVVTGGTVFDGTGAPGRRADVGIRDGMIAAISASPLHISPGTRVIEAQGRWVTPGFVDTHTHYDVEMLVSPGLLESVRHGVTTILVGNCSISGVYSGTVDVADLFSRVEALPRDAVLAALEAEKTWSDPAGWRRAVEQLPLGPNVASFLGHSTAGARAWTRGWRSIGFTCGEISPAAESEGAPRAGGSESIPLWMPGLHSYTVRTLTPARHHLGADPGTP